jgi:hypothetical protein
MEIPGGVPFEHLPPEIQEALKRQLEAATKQNELRNMSIESSRHRMLAFLNGLDEEQLLCLKGMLHMMVADPDNETAGYYVGMVSHLLSKFGYCPMCADKHSSVEDLLKPSPSEDNLEKAQRDMVEATDDEPEELVRDTTKRDTGHMAVRVQYMLPEDAANMSEYGLRAHGEGGYYCIGCNTKYPTIEDRMLRDPGPAGCHGCKQTTKWGGVEPTYDPDLKDD